MFTELAKELRVAYQSLDQVQREGFMIAFSCVILSCKAQDKAFDVVRFSKIVFGE